MAHRIVLGSVPGIEIDKRNMGGLKNHPCIKMNEV
jgi:hypothetical protein